MTHYLAFTLGPIDATIAQARKTRELWGASYILSVLMRELLTVPKLKDLGDKLLSPIVKDTEAQHGAGVFPDRCFWKVKTEPDAETIRQIIASAIQATAQITRVNKDYLQRYFRVCAATLNQKEGEQNSPILVLNQLLDTLELQVKLPPGDEENLLSRLDDNIQSLYEDGNQKTSDNTIFIRYNERDLSKMRLPSLIEVAASGLKRDPLGAAAYDEELTKPTNQAVLEYQRILREENNELEAKRKAKRSEAKSEQEAVLGLKKKLGTGFKFHHKYVCFVMADGDSLGATLAAIGDDPKKIEDFSTALGSFAQNAVNKIIEYRGIPVYAGGDDLLFVAPLQNEHGQHIFDLLKSLDGLFPSQKLAALQSQPSDPNKLLSVPSISFGLSISYYKYPMSESLEEAKKQLWYQAKSRCEKNAIAFRVLKHSGQPFGTVFGHKSAVATCFIGPKPDNETPCLLDACRKLDQSFLTSVMHRLTDLEILLADALEHGQTDYFFAHHFNESVHAQSDYIASVNELAKAAWEEHKLDIKATVNQVYAILRFVQFLNQEDHD